MDSIQAPENEAAARRRRRDDPIVVGGLSAVGRRSVCALLRTLGVQFPGPLGEQHVSQWFTLLFKRPSWVAKLRAGERPIPDGVATMQVLGSLLAGARLPRQQLSLLAEAAAEVAAAGYERDDEMPWWPPSAPFRHIQDYLAGPARGIGDAQWGWSHPLSHLFVEEAAASFPRLRFVYIVRHPLDMAFELTRTDQLRMWGPLCGLTEAKIKASPPSAQLAFWLYSTRATVDAGRRLLGDRFLLLWAEQLSEHPVGVAGRVASFAGLAPNEDKLREAASEVEKLPRTGSATERRLDELDPDMVKQAREWAGALSTEPSAEAASTAAEGAA